MASAALSSSEPWRPSLFRYFARWWLALANGVSALFLALPFAAPILAHQGRVDLANRIYSVYQVTCHEWAFRSYFLFGSQVTYTVEQLRLYGVDSPFDFRGSPQLGYKVAFCERNLAIYAAVLLAGLVYARFGQHVRALSFRAYLALISPLAVDGLSQLGGWRESTWELRTLTGLLFGAASVWLIYPRASALLAEWPEAHSRAELDERDRLVSGPR